MGSGTGGSGISGAGSGILAIEGGAGLTLIGLGDGLTGGVFLGLFFFLSTTAGVSEESSEGSLEFELMTMIRPMKQMTIAATPKKARRFWLFSAEASLVGVLTRGESETEGSRSIDVSGDE